MPDILRDLAADPANGWSIGSFGATGEFVRDDDEPAAVADAADRVEIVTARGAMRIAPTATLTPIAWDALSSDGQGWSHTLAFCCPRVPTPAPVVRPLGPDREAIRRGDRDDRLYDLGVGCGAVTMALRTADGALIAALDAVAGAPLASHPAIMAEVLRAQPHRVLRSPAGRIEVYQPIPPADGTSPEGPHTHLLPRLVVKDRPHSANVPIPDGLQSALSLHPRSPWRTRQGERHGFRPGIDAAFAPWLARYGLPADHAVEGDLRRAIAGGAVPDPTGWPATRRGRARARIVLRRMAAAGDGRAAPWRTMFDRLDPDEQEEDA